MLKKPSDSPRNLRLLFKMAERAVTSTAQMMALLKCKPLPCTSSLKVQILSTSTVKCSGCGEHKQTNIELMGCGFVLWLGMRRVEIEEW